MVIIMNEYKFMIEENKYDIVELIKEINANNISIEGIKEQLTNVNSVYDLFIELQDKINILEGKIDGLGENLWDILTKYKWSSLLDYLEEKGFDIKK